VDRGSAGPCREETGRQGEGDRRQGEGDRRQGEGDRERERGEPRLNDPWWAWSKRQINYAKLRYLTKEGMKMKVSGMTSYYVSEHLPSVGSCYSKI
jgi:hypothetical protein